MKFKELIDKSDFLKEKFEKVEGHFKEIEVNGISNNAARKIYDYFTNK